MMLWMLVNMLIDSVEEEEYDTRLDAAYIRILEMVPSVITHRKKS